MSDNDKDKTVIGGALPGGMAPMPGAGAGRPQTAPNPSPNQPTVIGGPLPGFGAQPGQGGFGAQPGGFGGQQPGFGGQAPAGGGDPNDPWGGGGGGFGAPAPSPGFGPGPGQQQPGQPMGQQPGGFGGGYAPGVGQGSPGFGAGGDAFGQQNPNQRTIIGGPFAPQDSFFPNPSTAQPTNYAAQGPKIDLRVALSAKGLGAGGPKSPMLAAAANLMILFGRLRTQMVDMDARPLMEHVTREIEVFEENCLRAGIDAHETQVAKYLLCSTADDIVQNIPGNDRHVWIQYSMTVRFFNRRTSGVGFFQEVEKALQAPAQRYQLLELAMVCLSLGFEGQYRTAPNGAVELGRIRTMIYESLRRVNARPDEDISPRWQPVDVGRRRRFGGTPLWVIGSVLGLGLMGAYFGLSMLISDEGSVVTQRLLSMHPVGEVGLVRPATVDFAPLVVDQASVVDPTQLERLRAAMKADIDAGTVVVDMKGDFIFVRVNNALLFATGKADTKPEFADLAARIADALNKEPGPVFVFGYTDNVPMSGRGRFKNNHDLSQARADSVKAALEAKIDDKSRFVVEGKAEADPIGDNASKEGQAQNRRVEIMIKRQETLAAVETAAPAEPADAKPADGGQAD